MFNVNCEPNCELNFRFGCFVKTLSRIFTAFLLCLGDRCAYLMVMANDLCPNKSLTVAKSIPFITI